MLNKMLKNSGTTKEEYLACPNRKHIRRVVALGWLRDTGRITLDDWLRLQLKYWYEVYDYETRHK